MLEELSKEDKKWRSIAFSICKDKSLADDLVNDMYLKMSESSKTYDQINDWYIYVVIKNLFLHHIRNKKEIPYPIDIFESIDCDEILKQRIELNNKLEELSFFDREILLHTSERSLRKNEEYLGKQFGMTVRVISYHRQKALERLKEKYNGRI